MNNYQKTQTRQTFYRGTSYPLYSNEAKTNTQAINFLGKTYQKMFDRPTPKISAIKK